ncbi:T9SS type B sorting domain-containing protein [Gaetbulibacter saemankumensis]|uniref:T9SS type B sorting domain-containing protein n=1 Tax=Gaetbulibacter saemankumensis TaxID=311208 RepID=UPI0003F7E42A|nr:T9SS type B sorting domain-containing protein [Gaetbulibacter saemankumensis]
MKKTTLLKSTLVVLFLLLFSSGIAQTYEPFTLRKNIELRGSMLVIGNNILGQDNNPFNDLTKDNQDINMQYIDIDGDASTFSSSSADILIPAQEDGSATTCYRVAYAALYWGAMLQSGSRTDINKVKFKTPNSSSYTDITGELIYDAIVSPIPAEPNEPGNTPYACYADVTSFFDGVTDIEGTYTVADVTSSLGFNNSTGLSAGWTLFIIYEDPNEHKKSFNTFDGFSHIFDGHYEEVNVTGFSTPPAGPIDLQFAYAALDGDRTKRATKLEINGKEVTTPLRTANKFFGSVIENSNGLVTPREPLSENTLGYDTGYLEIIGAEPEYVKNSDNAASFVLQVARGQADPIYSFFSCFAVDIITPDIELLKNVVDTSGTDIEGGDVNLGQRLFYEITYQSIGNDDVTEFTIKDILPENVIFDPNTDIDLSNAGGATVQSYDPVTRTLIFSIPDSSVEVDDPQFTIRIAVQVVPNCYDLSQACSNEIKNQAYATYRGVINPEIIQDEGSFASVECLGTPGSTNFLVDITNCSFERNEVLCGSSVVLTAADGYDSYSWSTSPTGTPVVGTGQSYTATELGTYYVQNTTSSTCISIMEAITVIPYGNTITNPIIPYADLLPICPNDGKVLPYIFLCGANDIRSINTGISDAVSIVWEKLDETSCPALTVDDCANENDECSWDQVGTGPDYNANDAGQFRIVINYPGGCFSIFYFNVYQNLLNPTVTAKDIICTTPGEVTVGGVPSGYEYSLDPSGPYQPSNVFTVNTPGYYTVYIRQVGVDTNPCIFETPPVYVRNRDFSVTTIVTQPYCNGDKGSVKIAVNDALPQYNYSISQGGTLVNSVGPIDASDYTFSNLNPGIYTIDVSTDDGCLHTEDIEIINPPLLTATSALTTPLTCTDGEITVYPEGGTPPYYYYVNSTTDFQTSPLIPVSSAGTFDITVVDTNNCSATTSITVDGIPDPVFTVTHDDILCSGEATGSINFNVTNANGYTIEYSIDNGVTYSTNPTFLNLTAGTYQTIIKYSLNGTDCFSTTEDIIITQPNNTLTASAGVSQLAGCGPNGEAMIRITNPQGGTAPYEFSFDNQATWTLANEAWMPSGTYTLYVRDANGCIYAMPNIIVDPEPIAPTISISNPDYNCDGSANAIVTVTNSTSNTYTYTYLLDGVENPNTTDPTTFLDVPDGSHTISVTYQLQSVPTYSNLLKEDFGSGSDTNSPGINATYYCFERQEIGTECQGSTRIQDGDYSVTSNIVNPYSAWINPVNHTTSGSGSGSNGRYLVVNIGSTIPKTAILYEKQIDDIIPNQPINVEFFAINLLKAGNTQYNPDLLVALVDAGGNEISSFNTGEIPKTESWEHYPKTPLTLDPGANTSLRFIVRSNVQQTSGNDVAIDDISVYQLPETCISQVDFPFIIEPGNAFSAEIINATNLSCNSGNDGTITIAAQNFDTTNGFQYSLDGVNWTTQMSSPQTITGLAAGSYTVQIRYDNTPNTCSFSFNQDIIAPDPVAINVTTTPVTCLDGSTITATASGGTPAYTFELLDNASNVINTFPSNGILANVPAGNYIVRVTDNNGCTDTTNITLVSPTAPTGFIINADYCYDTIDGTTLEVSASGGQPPYEFSISDGTNSSAYQTNPIFTNLTPGTYTITIRDAYGCTFDLPTETIEAQVTISTVLTKELDCTVSPDAIITGTITDGYPPYTYEVSINGGAFTNLGTASTPFTYNASTDGTYQFKVIDANACEALSNVISINPIDYPTATTNIIDASCNGDANGSVQIVPSGGVGPYTFSFNGSPFSTTSLYTGLTAGTYNYQIQDANECIFDGTATINEPTVLSVSATATAFSCASDNTKQSSTVTIAVPTTGTAPYLYSFNGSGYSASNTLEVNDNGLDQTITYSVQDANGCTDSSSLTISALNPPTDLDFSATPVTCDNTTSSVTVSATNGAGTLTYEILSPIVVGPQTSDVFSGLAPDTYVFRVTDTNGCYYTESFVIDPVTPIAITALKLSDVFCFNGNDGAAQFEVFNATNFTYTVDGGASQPGVNPIPLTNLTAGTYTVIVTDTDTGCTANASVTINQPIDAVSATATATNVHCNNYNSDITIIASGGTPSYTYAAVISGDPEPTSYSNSTIQTVDTNSGANLTWDVYVKDANDCTTITTVTITEDPLPTVSAPTVDNQCDVNSGFTFSVTATGIPPLSYSINGGASYQSSSTFTVNTPGNYTVTVRDGNGCTASSSTTTDVFPPISVTATMTKDLTCSAPSEAAIELNVSGGNPDYGYSVKFNGGAYNAPTLFTGNSFTYNTSIAGTYQFLITDANGCTEETEIITITDTVDPVILNVTQTQDISCNGESNASIDVTVDVNSGLPPFVINVYNDSTGNDYGTQTSGLAAGDYTITVTDARGCTDTNNITIAEPNPIVLDFDIDPITCQSGGVSLGRIIINSVTGGTPNYTYHVTGVNGYDQLITNQNGSTQVFEVVDFGIYQIIITDANGCTYLEQDITVTSPPDDLDINIDLTVDCITGGEATVAIGSASSITGNGPFYFAIYTGSGMTYPTGAWQPEDAPNSKQTVFTGLLPGATYTFVVYDDGPSKCYYYETADVAIPTNSTLTVSSLVPSNITCVGSADGNVSFDINSTYGTATDVTYEVFDSLTLTPMGISGSGTVPASGTLTVTNLGNLDFGNYVVVITEEAGATNAGCSIVSDDFNITESAIELDITANATKNENCNELGIITATASNGTAPYEYQAVPTTAATNPVNWVSSNTFNLAAGTYDIYVRDAYGCIKFDTATIIADLDPTINPVAAQCFDGTDFNITLSGTGIAPLTYSIGGAYQLSPDFTITAAGSYTVSIKDANGCIASDTYTVEPPLLLDADLTQDLTCLVDASISLSTSGGVAPYTYEVRLNGGAYSAIGSANYTTNLDGTYQFRVTDSQSCQAESNTITVTPNTVPTFTTAITDVTCNGGSDGSIVITASNGIAPYEYSSNGGSTWQASNVFSGLSQGTYTILVRDSKDCESLPVDETINEPTPVDGTGTLTQGLTCGVGNATQPAIVTITGSGGTPPYTYSFNGGVNYTSTETYTTYAAGTITAYIKDANGCIIATPIDVDIPALSVPSNLDFVSTPVTCLATTSDVTLTATDGVGPLMYEIISPIAVGPQASNVFNGLSPDTYVFTVTDANGCYYTESYTINPVTNITVSGLLVNDVSCNGSSDGTVDFTVANFSGTYSYTINGVSAGTGETNSTINLTGLPVGDQTIVVTDDTTGCTDTATITVNEPNALTLSEIENINANCNFGAQVTVEAMGGTPPYQYAFVIDGATPITSDYTNNNTAVLDPTISTNWDVWVIDSNGCSDMIDVAITTDPLPTITVPTLSDNQCNLTGDPFTFTVSNPTGVGPFTYSIGNGFQASPTFTVATPGDYYVTVKDANGCTTQDATPITVYPALDLVPTITTLPSCDDNDGVITITGSGGSGNYSFSISPNVGTVTGNVISNLPSGSYSVTIEDLTTGCTRNASVTLDSATPVTFTPNPIDVSCNGGSDGSIIVDLPTSNDNPIYTYEITAPIVVAPQNSNVFTGLAAGTYTVQVTSGRNCIATEDVTINEPAVINVPAPSVIEFACSAGTNAANFASITVTGVTGGSGNYTTYEFIKGGNIVQSGPNNVYTETEVLGGNFDINVYDNNGCLGSTTATIQPFIAIEDLDITIDNAITCTNDEDITVNVTSTGGTPNLEFTLEDANGNLPTQTNTTGIFTGLPIGNYIITVENIDTQCSLQTVHYVNDPNTFDLNIDSVVDVTCFNDNDGSVNITFIDRVTTPTDDAGAFSYMVTDTSGNPITSGNSINAGPITLNGFAAGTYTITATLTNRPYCAVTKNFTITAPNSALAISETHTEITCDGNNGTISATATGGWPSDYEYQLEHNGSVINPFTTNPNFTGLSAGNYIVSVRDSQGCIAPTNVILVDPTPITITASADTNMLSCFGDQNATITVDLISGGQGSNYTYTLNMTAPMVSSSGPQLSPVFTNLGTGTYNVTVTDGYNCTATSADIVIAEPTKIEASLVKTSSQTCLLDANLTLSATGGTGPYEYSTDASFSTVIGSFVTDITFPVTPGTYQYYVRDANLCSDAVSNEITIDPLPALTLELDKTNATINCAGDNTGVIVATAQGGLGNYVYTLQDEAGNDIPTAVQDSPGVFTELVAGRYQVFVESGDCDTTSEIVEITEPSTPLSAQLLTTDVTCNGANDGMVEVSATGGTGIIKYAISPQMDQFFDEPIFDNLAPGDYQIIVQDILGCYELYDFTIYEPNPVLLSIVPNSIIPEVCYGDMNGSFSVTISGGTPPYSVALDDINGTYTTGTATQTQFDFTGLEGGDHTVFVIDSEGCESEWNITFPESVLIDPVAIVEFGCTNNMSTNMVTVEVDESITDPSQLEYALDGGPYQTSNIYINVPAGLDHYIDVRHTNGCIKRTPNFDIAYYEPLQLTIGTGGLNEIVANATGGTGDYTFTVNGDSYGSDNTFIIYSSGTYTVTVTDSNGCTASASDYFEYIDVCIPNYFTPNGDGNLDEWGPGCTSQYKDLVFNIFDRYGRRVAQLRVGETWDGTYHGHELPTGDYWYVVKLNDPKDDREFVGHFTLYR